MYKHIVLSSILYIRLKEAVTEEERERKRIGKTRTNAFNAQKCADEPREQREKKKVLASGDPQSDYIRQGASKREWKKK